MINISIDTETIPNQDPQVKAAIDKDISDQLFNLSPLSSYSKAKQDEWLANKQEELATAADDKFRKLALDGANNHIISIGVNVNGERKGFTIKSIDVANEEKRIIQEFFDFTLSFPKGAFEVFRFIGHNIIGFDLKILKQRCMILGVRPPLFMPFNAKPWDNNPYDTMTQWDARTFISMDKIAKALGLEGKGDVDGSMVYDMFLAEKFHEIGEYCMDDAEKALKIYNRMTFQDQFQTA